MENKNGKQILHMIMEENLVSAQETIKQQLSNRLGSVLDTKFEEYASTIFEAKTNKKNKTKGPRWQDSDGDGKWYEEGDDVKKSVNEEKYCEDGDCEDMEDSEDVEEGKKQYEEEEEGKSHKKKGKKGKNKGEEGKDEEGEDGEEED
jgi:hypothetical protein